jgi:hypothetical protein
VSVTDYLIDILLILVIVGTVGYWSPLEPW